MNKNEIKHMRELSQLTDKKQEKFNLIMRLSLCSGLLLLGSVVTFAHADEAADQLERARLLRDLLETRSGSQSASDSPVLPGAKIESERVQLPDVVRRQQVEDTQWRNLLGAQQAQIYAPSTQAIPESQWRLQTFDRDRRAADLSADILRRSQEFLSGGHR